MKKILLVEDEPDVALMTKLLLEFEGYGITTVSNGNAAIRALDAFLPDLILTDWMMPVMDGIELCRRVKGDARLHGVPIVLMSAAKCPAAMVQPWDAFLSKPFLIDTLLVLLRKLLDGH